MWLLLVLPLVPYLLRRASAPQQIVVGAGFFQRARRSLSRSVRKVDWNKAAQVAMTQGAAIAQTAAGPQVGVAMALLTAAQQGDPAAAAQVAAAQAGAQAGSPQAQEQLAALQVAKLVQEQVQAQQAVAGDDFED